MADLVMTRRERAADCVKVGDFAWAIATTDEDGDMISSRAVGDDERPTHMYLRTPVGAQGAWIAITPAALGNGASWNWDGNRDQPTLTPSIDGGIGHWHGWVTAGMMSPGEPDAPSDPQDAQQAPLSGD